MILLPELINHKNALEIRDAGLKLLRQSKDIGTFEVEASALKDFDSSVLAILLAWKRIKPQLLISKAPSKLLVLAKVYGLTELFSFKEVQ